MPFSRSEHRDRLQRGRGGGGRRDLCDQGGGEGGPGAGDGGAVHPAERDAVLQHLRHQVSRHGDLRLCYSVCVWSAIQVLTVEKIN